jgi:hypothetical protein
MSFFVGKNDSPLEIMNPDVLMRAAPEYYGPRFDAIAELRSQDDGSLHKGNEFRRVASLVNVPLLNAVQVCEPGFFKDRKTFYDWLDKEENKRYCTYQRPGRVERAALVQRDIGHIGGT